MSTDLTALILPGLGDSGPDHWQSHWERRDPTCLRLVQTEWDAPRCSDWVACLDTALIGVRHPVVLIAHSSSCAMVAKWAVLAGPARHARVRGALLVAPSDPLGPNYPAGPEGFAPVPMVRLPFPTIVVASTNDAYVTAERAREYATAWGSRYVELPDAGHINVAAGFGPWPEGWALLDELRTAPLPDESLPPWLASEATLDEFLAGFRDGSFPIAWWTHGAHVAMASAVLWDTAVPRALDEMRINIRRYNERQGGQNTDSSGYHETLTRLWVGTVAAAMSTVPYGSSRLDAVRQVYRTFARRSALYREWYPYDVIRSTEARRAWVAPDLARAGAAAELFGASH